MVPTIGNVEMANVSVKTSDVTVIGIVKTAVTKMIVSHKTVTKVEQNGASVVYVIHDVIGDISI